MDQKNAPIDILAVVIHALPVRISKKDAEEYTLQKFVVINEEMQPVMLTMWNAFVSKEGVQIVDNLHKLPVLICRRLKVVCYNGVALSTRTDSAILIDPPVLEARQLKNWAMRNEKELAHIVEEESYNKYNAQITDTNSPGGEASSSKVRTSLAHKFDMSEEKEEGYRMHAGSVSPVHRPDNRYSPDFDHLGAPPRSRGYGSGRDHGRYRDYSPRYGHARDGARFNGKGFDRTGYGPGPFRGEVVPRNNPNMRPREGDWYCSSCNNLNFARREICNNCRSPRYPPARSPPRRGYPAAPPPPRRFPGPPADLSPGRLMNGYRSLPRGWARDEPRDFRAGGPPYPRHEGRFPDPPLRRDRPDYAEDAYRERNIFDRPVPLDWVNRDRARDNLLNERKGYERQPPSPLLSALPPRGQWAPDIRERSRSPLRGGAPPKGYRRDMYMERGRDDRGVMGRDGF